jgi:hypothetical protein
MKILDTNTLTHLFGGIFSIQNVLSRMSVPGRAACSA